MIFFFYFYFCRFFGHNTVAYSLSSYLFREFINSQICISHMGERSETKEAGPVSVGADLLQTYKRWFVIVGQSKGITIKWRWELAMLDEKLLGSNPYRNLEDSNCLKIFFSPRTQGNWNFHLHSYATA